MQYNIINKENISNEERTISIILYRKGKLS